MINLSDQWSISLNELSVDVYKRYRNQKTGKEYTTPMYYYPNLEKALEGIIDRSLCGDLKSLEMVVDKIKELKADIMGFLAKTDK